MHSEDRSLGIVHFSQCNELFAAYYTMLAMQLL